MDLFHIPGVIRGQRFKMGRQHLVKRIEADVHEVVVEQTLQLFANVVLPLLDVPFSQMISKRIILQRERIWGSYTSTENPYCLPRLLLNLAIRVEPQSDVRIQ
jgi:hypothetical protein